MGARRWIALFFLLAGCALPAAVPRTNLSFRSDETLFTLFAWMNAAGYDDETPGMPMVPLRRRIREALGEHPQRSRWQQFYREHSPATGYLKTAQLTDYAFFLTPAPHFTPTIQPLWGGSYFSLFQQELYVMTRYWGLNQELQRFYREADIAQLWAQFRPHYDQLNHQVAAKVKLDMARLDTYVRLPDYIPVTVVPNLIGETYVGHTAYSQGQAFLVIHPKSDLDDYAAFVRHEYLHPQINPLVERFRSRLQAKMDQLAPLVSQSPAIRIDGYDMRSIVEESLIRAIEGVLFQPDSIEAQYRHGFILTKAFAEQLPGYMAGKERLERFVERAFASVDVSLEIHRWKRWQNAP